jgi:hypothetical protein
MSFSSPTQPVRIRLFRHGGRYRALPVQLPEGVTPAPGAVVEAYSHWIDGFGFMTMERQGPDQWLVLIHDLQGQIRNRCQINGRHCAANAIR